MGLYSRIAILDILSHAVNDSAKRRAPCAVRALHITQQTLGVDLGNLVHRMNHRVDTRPTYISRITRRVVLFAMALRVFS